MTTGRDLVTGSLQLLEIIGAGETPTGEDAVYTLSVMNDLISSWTASMAPIYAEQRETFPLMVGTSSYTIGTGGNFNTSRPQNYRAVSVTIDGKDTPLRKMDVSEYESIYDKSLSGDPEYYYEDAQYPLATIKLYPVPSRAANINIVSEKPLTSFATLNTDIDLPHGWVRALKSNTAVEAGPAFGREASITVQKSAIESKGALIRSALSNDVAVLSDAEGYSSGAFNFQTGTYE